MHGPMVGNQRLHVRQGEVDATCGYHCVLMALMLFGQVRRNALIWDTKDARLEALRKVASAIRDASSRPSDLPARYGGEEFAIVTAHSDIRDALALAEILRRKIERLAVPHDGSSAGVVTASFGVAVLVPDEQDGGAQLIALADSRTARAFMLFGRVAGVFD